MSLKKIIYFILISLLFIACTPQEEEKKTVIPKEQIPTKITMLFITQAHCPSCKQLKETMELKKPAQLIRKYFHTKIIYLGEKIPKNLIPPNGTPTVYFLGYKDELLIEPMIGEKDEASLMIFLEDALLEYKTLYNIDLTLRDLTLRDLTLRDLTLRDLTLIKKDNNETNSTI